MRSSPGPHLDLRWVLPLLLCLAVGLSVGAFTLVPLSPVRFAALLANSLGTVLMASAFEAQIPLAGTGGAWPSLRKAITELPKLQTPATFYVLRRYTGGPLLLVGALLSASGV